MEPVKAHTAWGALEAYHTTDPEPEEVSSDEQRPGPDEGEQSPVDDDAVD